MSQPIRGQVTPPATTPTLVITPPSPTPSPLPISSPPPTISPPPGIDLPSTRAELPPAGTSSSARTNEDPEVAFAIERVLFLNKVRGWLLDRSLVDALPVLIWLLDRSPTYGEFCAEKATQFGMLFSEDETALFTFKYPEHAQQIKEFFWDMWAILAWGEEPWEDVRVGEFEVMFKGATGLYVERRLMDGYPPLVIPGQEEAAACENRFETAHLLQYVDEPLDDVPDPAPETPALLPNGRPVPSKVTRDFAKKISANEFSNAEIERLLTRTDIMSLCDRYFQLEDKGEFRTKGKARLL